jgi:hypothetical protein
VSYRVVTIYDDESGWTRVAVVKTLEEDPSVWGVVGWYGTTYAALKDAQKMQDERDKLAHIEGLSYDRNNGYARGRIRSGPRTAQTAGGLDGPTPEVAPMGNLQ